MILAILTAFVASVSTVQAEPMPDFQVFSKTQFAPLAVPEELVVLETEQDYVLKSPLTNFASYDYYYLQLPPDRSSHERFQENIHVVFEKPGEFLIVEVRNENQLLALSHQAHHEAGACGMIQKITGEPIVLEKRSAPQMVQGVRADIQSAQQEVKIDNILQTMETMVSWQTRFESDPQGVQTGERLKTLYEDLIPSDRDDVTVELLDHRGSNQKSIRVRILGQSRPDEIVILGSHIDSINRSNNADAPGADDNASGTATNLEVFRTLMTTGFRPDRTLEIHGYGAEEIGLVGSKEMAQEYKRNKVNVISMVQFDMNAFASGNPKITFVSNGTDSSLTSQLQTLVRQYNDIPSATGFLLFGSSDHAAWAEQGFPVAFPTEDPFGFNRKIHTADDTMANINSPKQIEEFAKLGVAYFMDFSDQ